MNDFICGAIVGIVLSLPTTLSLLGVCWWWSLRSRMLGEEGLEYRMAALKIGLSGGCSGDGKPAVTVSDAAFGFASAHGDEIDDAEGEEAGEKFGFARGVADKII